MCCFSKVCPVPTLPRCRDEGAANILYLVLRLIKIPISSSGFELIECVLIGMLIGYQNTCT